MQLVGAVGLPPIPVHVISAAMLGEKLLLLLIVEVWQQCLLSLSAVAAPPPPHADPVRKPCKGMHKQGVL
jgi:hypothetical protein